MIYTIVTAFMAFVATNIDDLFINMLLFMGSRDKKQGVAITTGKLMGTALLLALSLAGASGLQLIAGEHLWLLGFIPIALGIKELVFLKKGDNPADSQDIVSGHSPVNIMLVTLASGADNIGVYIPLLAGCNRWQTAVTAAMFFAMTCLWCTLGKKLAHLPALKTTIEKYRPLLVPVVYIALGLYIILT